MKLYKKLPIPLQRHERKALRIVGDGAIATIGFAEGRLLPVLIVDTSERADLEEHLRLHNDGKFGDAKTTWADMQGVSEVCLILELDGPTKVSCLIAFDVIKQFVLVDQIIQNRGFYLRMGRPGDRVKDTMEVPTISIEVAESGFDDHWNKTIRRTLVVRGRRNGMNRKRAAQYAEDFIAEWRKFGALRFGARAQNGGRPATAQPTDPIRE